MRLMLAGVAAAVAMVIGGLAQAPSTPATPQTCSGSVTVLLNGSPLPGVSGAAGCVLNLTTPGNPSGIVATATPDPSIGGTDISFTPNSVLFPTYDTIHANQGFCQSTNGTTVYHCSLVEPAGGKALTAYNLGLEVLLDVDTTCATSCTLSIDSATGSSGIEQVTLTQANGTTPPNGTLIAGQAHRVWYDGAVFRME